MEKSVEFKYKRENHRITESELRRQIENMSWFERFIVRLHTITVWLESMFSREDEKIEEVEGVSVFALFCRELFHFVYAVTYSLFKIFWGAVIRFVLSLIVLALILSIWDIQLSSTVISITLWVSFALAVLSCIGKRVET